MLRVHTQVLFIIKNVLIIWLVFLFVFIGVMVLPLRPFFNCSRRVRGTLYSGSRDSIRFKSNLAKDLIEKESILERRIKKGYEESMRHDGVPLLEKWESYESSLPVQEFEGPVILLYKFPYWTNERDLADELIHAKSLPMRGNVPYLAAPTKYGKTCGHFTSIFAQC